MKKAIDISTWSRRAHYHFFRQFDEPFFGVTLQVDCTYAYQLCKKQQQSFFLFYLYQSLKAANHVEAFRYRIIDAEPYVFDKVHASPTINRPDGSFGFAYIDYHEDEQQFYALAQEEIKAVKESNDLLPAMSGENVIHYSALPWLDFTSISHARHFKFADSSPKISFGKLTPHNNGHKMPVSVHVHHALMDGYHVGLFAEAFQLYMNASDHQVSI